MNRTCWMICVLLLGADSLSLVHAQFFEDTMEPAAIGIQDIGSPWVPEATYVGNDVCRLCHEAVYQHWLGTKHARAFVSLRSRLAIAMGKEQGITADSPAKSGMCLSCHATAHDVAAAYRGPGFRMGEGVACEWCHGPGGTHVQAMEDPHNGLDDRIRMPGEASCHACHYPKESHALLETPPFDFGRDWPRIAHSRTWEQPEDRMEPTELGIWHVRISTPAAQYTGSVSCAQCHAAAYEKWQRSAHARAFGVLRSDTGAMIGMREDRDVIGGSSKNGNCLACHATAHDVAAAYRAPGFRMGEGVGCEQCHGPGGDHIREMQNQNPVSGRGLIKRPDEDSCMDCHRRKRSHDVLGRPPFSYPESWDMIAH